MTTSTEPRPAAPQTAGTEVELADNPDAATGHLAISPGQSLKELSPEQNAALSAIVNFDPKEPSTWPHIEVFLHQCQVLGLDPWRRQVYLIRHGQGKNAKYVVVTGIDGYRYLAQKTKRFIDIKVRWTGADDHKDSYVETVDPDTGDVVMKRRWYDRWPSESRGNPGAAKAILRHYNLQGEEVITEAIADWFMFAAYKEKWEERGGRNIKVHDRNGNVVKELNSMWEKGGPHMLAKCAQALAIRMAFPDAVAGVFVEEEVDRIRFEAEQATQEEQQSSRQAAFRKARQEQQVEAGAQAAVTVLHGEVEEVEDPGDEGPQDEAEAVEEPEADEKTLCLWLLEELTEMVGIRGADLETVKKAFEERLGMPLEEAGSADLLSMIGPARQAAVEELRRQERHTEAEAYAAAGSDRIAPMAELLGWEIGEADGEAEAADGEEPVEGLVVEEPDEDQ